MSGASVEAVSPVSAPPVSERSAVAPEVRAAEFMAIVPVAVSQAMVRLFEKSPLPCTAKSAPGLVVPIPRLPEPNQEFPDEKSETNLPEPTFNPPAKVEVAEEDVALIAATCGVEVDVRLPEESNPASMLASPDPRFKVLKVFVPEKVLSSASKVDEANVHVEVEYEYSCPLEFAARPPDERPENVMVPVAVRPATERSPETRVSPWTESVLEGVVVPMPTLLIL